MNTLWSDLGLLIFRLGFGLSLAFGHGLGKLPPPERFIEGVGKLGFPFPVVFAWAASLSEFAGALCVAIGLFVRPSAAFVAFTMGVAAFMQHRHDPFGVKEMALLYLFAALGLVFTGGGRFVLDAKFRKH